MDVQRERPGAVSGLARQGLDERGPHSLATCADLDGHGEFWQRATVRAIEEGRVVHVPPGRPEGISRVVSGDECDVCRRRQGPVHRGRPSTGADDPPTRWPGGPSLGGTPRRPVQTCALARYRSRTSPFPQHPDEHRPEHPILLAVNQQFAEGAGSAVAPVLRSRSRRTTHWRCLGRQTRSVRCTAGAG